MWADSVCEQLFLNVQSADFIDTPVFGFWRKNPSLRWKRKLLASSLPFFSWFVNNDNRFGNYFWTDERWRRAGRRENGNANDIFCLKRKKKKKIKQYVREKLYRVYGIYKYKPKYVLKYVYENRKLIGQICICGHDSKCIDWKVIKWFK